MYKSYEVDESFACVIGITEERRPDVSKEKNYQKKGNSERA